MGVVGGAGVAGRVAVATEVGALVAKAMGGVVLSGLAVEDIPRVGSGVVVAVAEPKLGISRWRSEILSSGSSSIMFSGAKDAAVSLGIGSSLSSLSAGNFGRAGLSVVVGVA